MKKIKLTKKQIKNIKAKERNANRREMFEAYQLKLQWDVPTFPVWRARREAFLWGVLELVTPDMPAYEEAKKEMCELIATYPAYYKGPLILQPVDRDSLENPTEEDIKKAHIAGIKLTRQMNMAGVSNRIHVQSIN